jgi:mono/diheme cytochrome c family protein
MSAMMRGMGLLVFAVLSAADAFAADPVLSPGFRFSEQTGEALYSNVCQACHMGNGEGATGAGRYPSLAKNPKLEMGDYATYIVLHGQKAMPPVGRLMTDDQVAAVVTYIRTHFGNDYKDPVTAEQVKQAR